MSLLALKDISLTYDGAKGSTFALSDVCLDVSGGESIAIIGPSGCGKSSLLRIACGLLQPTSGSVEFLGKEVTEPNPECGLILQDFGLLPWKSVLANAAIGLKVRGVPRSERRDRAMAALEMVDLASFANSYPDELSGGMKQRLAIARTLAIDVKLLLMDEPLSALDALLRERMQEMIIDLWKRTGYAQVIVTHSIDEAVLLGQRIVVMSKRPGHILHVIQNPEAASEGYRTTPAFHGLVDSIRVLLLDDVNEDVSMGTDVEEGDAHE